MGWGGLSRFPHWAREIARPDMRRTENGLPAGLTPLLLPEPNSAAKTSN